MGFIIIVKKDADDLLVWGQHHQGTDFLFIVAKDVVRLVRQDWWSRDLFYNHQKI